MLDFPFYDHDILGTPEYLPPEVILHQPYGHGIDWWSLGIILFKMLTGSLPYLSRITTELFLEITDGE